MAKKITLNVNGKVATVEVDDPQMPLLYVLRGFESHPLRHLPA